MSDQHYQIPLVNNVPAALITMAGAHRAWALRFMPWLVLDV